MRTAIRSTLGFGLALAMATGVAATATSDAEAQVVAPSFVSTTGKGIAGGALLGGEVGFLVLAGAGARAGWMYGTIPTALAIGGGIGGYYIEKGVADGSKVPMYMLAGGMALIIPTVVIALSAGSSSYQADEGGASDTGTKPAAGGGGSGGASTGGPKPPQRGIGPMSQHHVAPIMPRSFALVNFDEKTSPRVSVPAVQVSPMYSRIELSQFGGTQRYQVDAPLLAITF